jgi:hypothetical protein
MSKTNEERIHRGEKATNQERSPGNLAHLHADSAIRGAKSHTKTIAANAAKSAPGRDRRLSTPKPSTVVCLRQPRTASCSSIQNGSPSRCESVLDQAVGLPPQLLSPKGALGDWPLQRHRGVQERVSRVKNKRYVRYEDLPLKSHPK